MSRAPLSIAHLDYLQGNSIDLTGRPPDPSPLVPVPRRRLFRITGIGRYTKTPLPIPESNARREPAQ